MGVIVRQSFKNSIINYLGVAVGALSTILIYPLDKSTYGLVQFLIGASMLLGPFISLGANSLNTRFFPLFKNKNNGHHGFWGVLMLLTFVGIITIGSLFYVFEDSVLHVYRDKSALFKQYIPFILPLAALLGLLHLNVTYASNFQRIAIPSIFKLLIKFTLPLLILAHYFSYITMNVLVWALLCNYIIALLGSLIYNKLLDGLQWKIDWKFLSGDKVNQMMSYAGYSILAGIGGALAFRIDSVMVPSLMDFKSNGAYSIALFIGNVISIPSAAIILISSPIISKAFQENDMDHVKEIYSKSSINLLIIGLLFFGLIIPNVNDLFSLMPHSEEMVGGYWVVFFIGLAKLAEMATSVNHQIIGHSNFYKLNLYMILFLAVANVLLNLWLIPIYGIIGAAIATCISLSLYNLLKLAIIYWKLSIQPFTLSSLWLAIFGGVMLLIISQIHPSLHPIVNIFIKVVLFSLVYLIIVYRWNLSEDLNKIINNVTHRILARIK